MSIHSKKFSDVRTVLNNANIFFNINGADRHLANDTITFSDTISVEPYCAFLNGSNLVSMGSFSYSWSMLPHEISVGRYCSIAKGLQIMGTRHPYERISTSSFTYDKNFIIFKKTKEDFCSKFKTTPPPPTLKKTHIVISDDVWIGMNVLLARGISIGTGAIVAANAVVTKDVLPYTIVGGNPAKLIKKRFSDDIIDLLLASKWWDYNFSDFDDLNIANPKDFVLQLSKKISIGKCMSYMPLPLTIHNL